MKKATVLSLVLVYMLAPAFADDDDNFLMGDQKITVSFEWSRDEVKKWQVDQPSNGQNHEKVWLDVKVYRENQLVSTHEFLSRKFKEDGDSISGFTRDFAVRGEGNNDNSATHLEGLAESATESYSKLYAKQLEIVNTEGKIRAAVAKADCQDKAHTTLGTQLSQYRKDEEEYFQQIDTTMDKLRSEKGNSTKYGWYYTN